MEKVFYVRDKNKLIEDEELKRRGFEYESAENFDKKEKGFYFIIKGDKEFFEKCEVLKEAEEIKGEEKEEIIKKFKEHDRDVVSGMGTIFQ